MFISSLFAALMHSGPPTEDTSAEPAEPETSDILDGPVDASSEPTPPPSEPTSPPIEPTPPPSEPPPTVVTPSPPAPTPATETKTKLAYEIEGEPGKGLTVKVGKAFSLNVKS